MKKILLTTISAAVTSSLVSFASHAGVNFIIDLGQVNFRYEAAHQYEELGTLTDYSKPGATPGLTALSDKDNGGAGDGFDDIDPTKSMSFATLRDGGNSFEADYDPAISGLNDANGDGRGDAAFGDPAFATSMASIEVNDGTNPPFAVVTDVAVDLRLVLESQITGAGDYGIIEEYSFLDLFTQSTAPAFGLGLDPNFEEEATLTVSEPSDGQFDISITGSIFGDVFAEDLPWFDVDTTEPITWEITGTVTNDDYVPPAIGAWDNFNYVGSGLVKGTTAEVSEPATIGIFGLALTGLGILQRRRKKMQD